MDVKSCLKSEVGSRKSEVGSNNDNNNDNNNNNNNNNNDNNNDLLTDPLGGSSLLNYIDYNYKINRIKIFTNYRVELQEKLTNRSVLYFLKNSMRVLKRFCNLYNF